MQAMINMTYTFDQLKIGDVVTLKEGFKGKPGLTGEIVGKFKPLIQIELSGTNKRIAAHPVNVVSINNLRCSESAVANAKKIKDGK
jgi:hypothetical protein